MISACLYCCCPFLAMQAFPHHVRRSFRMTVLPSAYYVDLDELPDLAQTNHAVFGFQLVCEFHFANTRNHAVETDAGHAMCCKHSLCDMLWTWRDNGCTCVRRRKYRCFDESRSINRAMCQLGCATSNNWCGRHLLDKTLDVMKYNILKIPCCDGRWATHVGTLPIA